LKEGLGDEEKGSKGGHFMNISIISHDEFKKTKMTGTNESSTLAL
jgi:hypothetical protein